MATFLGDDDTVPCQVVINGDEQYSIWPTDRPIPNGWRQAGYAGTRAECIAYIDRVWAGPTIGA